MQMILHATAVCLFAFVLSAQTQPAKASKPGVFRPGEIWLDTAAHPIQAHSAGILLHHGVYYWYGEDKTLGNFNKTGVSAYSSRDLYNWTRVGVVLPKEAVPEKFRDQGICERPKVIYCPKTRRFVMWMHLDSADYSVASAGVASADKAEGPFKFLGYSRPIRYDFGFPENDRTHQKELGSTFRDMNLFVDDDGKAYVFYAAEGNPTMYVSRLNADFTGVETPIVEGKTWARILVKQSREAPAPFKYKGKYYLITSGTSGWAPNPASYAVADNILGPYTVKGNPCVGADAATTFHSQSTYVLPAPGKGPGAFIFLADRWFEKNLTDSRYVWLPLQVKDDSTLTLEWRDQWDLTVFDK
jgi:beta-xylosidase